MKQIWSDHVLEFLQAHPLFVGAGFSQAQLISLLERYQVEDVFVSKPTTLHHSNDLQEGFYLVLRGKVFMKGQFTTCFDEFQAKVKEQEKVKEKAMKERLSLVVYPSQFCGLAGFMATKEVRWRMYVEASAMTEVLFFPKSAFLNRMARVEVLDAFDSLDARFWQQLFILQSNELKSLQKHLYFLQLKGLRTKLVAFLLDRAETCRSHRFTLPYSREELAHYLNIARPSMSRELAALKQEGYIDFSLRSFTLLDIASLRSFLI